ncbi:PdaC/SigV domain-containing protein [Parablastomonas sp. CN1-191]|uniref:PdaC/SigV domain-containing protein n=1 Tax=Parablastomonas sp. CN1-191 TaxID=3400908 RepID=UPI003BF90ED6
MDTRGKNRLRGGAALLAALMLASCGDGTPSAEPTRIPYAIAAEGSPEVVPEASGQTVEVVPTSATATPDADNGRSVKQEADYYLFEFLYPNEAYAIAPLRAWFDTTLATTRSAFIAAARKDRDAAFQQHERFRRYSLITRWRTAAETERFLSLSSFTSTYTGGAHGLIAFRTMVWDRAARTRRPVLSLFTSSAALRKAIAAPFCAELDRARAVKREAPVSADHSRPFEDCIDPTAEAVALYTGQPDLEADHDDAALKGRTFDHILILVAPYSAGPWAEGSYEVKLPVTPEVLAAVRPRYRKAFSVSRPEPAPAPRN